jgi:hypothetical protein
MKTAATVVGVFLFVVGTFGVAWPFPMFTLNEPYLTWYQMYVLRLSEQDMRPGNFGAAAPFFWAFFTAPIGFGVACLGATLIFWGKSK